METTQLNGMDVLWLLQQHLFSKYNKFTEEHTTQRELMLLRILYSYLDD
jgi:hypothetical protein